MRRYLFVLVLSIYCCTPYSYGQNLDVRLLHSINGQKSLYGASRVLSESTMYIAAGIPVAMGISSLIMQDDALFKEALCVGVSLGVAVGLSYGLKYAVNRPRPYVAYPDYIQSIDTERSPSYPSTHTSIAFATATSLTLLYPKWYVAVPTYLWAAGVGYSRMNIGVHFPSDVFAGALLGAGSAYLTYELNKLLWRKTNNKRLIGLQSYL